MTPEGREMRFDVEKWEREHPFRGDCPLEQVVTAAEAALLAPSPCGVEGHLAVDWIERSEMVEWDGPAIVNENTGFFYCRRCAELERQYDELF